jgi:hypothetical protein
MHMLPLSGTVLRRTVLSVLVGLLSVPTPAQSIVGSGPAFSFLERIAVEASGSLVVLDEKINLWHNAKIERAGVDCPYTIGWGSDQKPGGG